MDEFPRRSKIDVEEVQSGQADVHPRAEIVKTSGRTDAICVELTAQCAGLLSTPLVRYDMEASRTWCCSSSLGNDANIETFGDEPDHPAGHLRETLLRRLRVFRAA